MALTFAYRSESPHEQSQRSVGWPPPLALTSPRMVRSKRWQNMEAQVIRAQHRAALTSCRKCVRILDSKAVGGKWKEVAS
jgi:hypothetical protein